MILSKSCVYAIRATLYITAQENREYIPVKEIAKELNLSFHFLTKILQGLTNASLMKSYRGPNGGVAMARSADSIYLIEVIDVMDGLDIFSECLLGLPNCNDINPCPLHEEWAKNRTSIHKMFQTMTLSQIVNNIDKLRLGL